MIYDLFLFDLDDTLLDFKASERLSFFATLESFGVSATIDTLFDLYQVENRALWTLFEQAKTTKEHLKVERFRKTFLAHGIEIDPAVASHRYLEALPESVVLIPEAVETLQWLSGHGEIGIVTNGMSHVQDRRIQNSALAPFISFVSVSEEAGFAKPDVRFFEFSAKKARNFNKPSTLVVGDRLETDIAGANAFGIDACWFNPDDLPRNERDVPKFEIRRLSQLRDL